MMMISGLESESLSGAPSGVQRSPKRGQERLSLHSLRGKPPIHLRRILHSALQKHLPAVQMGLSYETNVCSPAGIAWSESSTRASIR